MKFKVTQQLTNVRSPKSTDPIVETTPTPGNIKLSVPAAEKIGVNNEDFVAVVKGVMDETIGEQIFIVKGHKDEKEQFGSKLASSSGKDGGSLQFSSENAYKALNGDKDSKHQYMVGEGVDDGDGNTYFPLTFEKTVEKVARVRKEKNEKEQSGS